MSFNIDRKGFGLTYSNPTTGCEVVGTNPIPGRRELVDALEEKWGSAEWVCCEELHKDEGKHFHVWIKFEKRVQSSDPRAFDVYGVHPRIEPKAPGPGWMKYVKKSGEWISNRRADAFIEASKKRTWAEAEEVLWNADPRFMFQSGKQAEDNWNRKHRKPNEGKVYYGPWPKIEWPEDRCLVLWGKPGTGKTQWARYLAAHATKGGVMFCKGSLDKAKKHYKPGDYLIFDDIVPFEKWSTNDWNSIVDVENGGSVNLRNKPLDLEPGPRIVVHNRAEDGDHDQTIIDALQSSKVDRRVFRFRVY